MTAVKVIDASALAALLFGEPGAEEASNLLRGAQLIAPTLLGDELANTCLKKMQAYPDQSVMLLRAFERWTDMGIDIVSVDQMGVLQRLQAKIVTRDQQLTRATARWRAG